MRTLPPATALLVALLACGSSTTPNPVPDPDAGPADAGPDATGDAGPDAMPDAGTDAGPDAGPPPTPAEILAASWKRLPNGPTDGTGKQDDLYFVDPDEGWSVNGDLGRIFHTTDGGATWTKQLDQPGTYFRAVLFLDSKRGFAGNIGTGYYPGVTDPRPLFATTDGGVTWKAVTTITGPMPVGICNFSKVDDQHLFATGRVGGPSYFLTSSDGGATWASIDLTSKLAFLIDSHFSTKDDGYVVGSSTGDQNSSCTILHTADAGKTWTTAFASKGKDEMCWKFSFPSPSVGYASVLTFGSELSSFIKTTDGGKTWEELPFTGTSYPSVGAGFITDEIGWIAGDGTPVPAYRTKDGGKTWQPDASLGPATNRFRFLEGRTGYAIGSQVYKLTIP